jgi:hypothetical protein
MKKLILALTVSTMALTGALYATDSAPTQDKDKAPCCDKAKTAVACTDAKMACCGADAKGKCCKMPSKGVAMSPKAAEQAAH